MRHNQKLELTSLGKRNLPDHLTFYYRGLSVSREEVIVRCSNGGTYYLNKKYFILESKEDYEVELVL